MSHEPVARPLEGDALRIEQLKEKLAQVQGQNLFSQQALNATPRRANLLLNPGSRPVPPISLPSYGRSPNLGPVSPGYDGRESIRSTLSRHNSGESVAYSTLSVRSSGQRRIAPVIGPAPGKNLQEQRKEHHPFRLMPSHTTNQASQKTAGAERAVPSSEVVPFLYQDLDDVKRTGKASVNALPSPTSDASNPMSLPAGEQAPAEQQSIASALNKDNALQHAPSISKPRDRGTVSDSSSSTQTTSKGTRSFFNNLLHKKKRESPRQTPDLKGSPLLKAHDQFTSPFETPSGPLGTPPRQSSIKLPGLRRQTLQPDNVLRTKNSVISEKSPGTSISTNGVVLDTDMSHMSGIVKSTSTSLIPKDDFSFGNTRDNSIVTGIPEDFGEATWAPPESWAVRRPEDIARDEDIFDGPDPLDDPIVSDAQEGLSHSISKGIDTPSKRGPNHQMRIFRGDWTFATVACGLQTTVETLMVILARKFFLSSVSNHQILLERNGLSRILQSWEKPFLLQLNLLEEAGYTDQDRLEEIGREDNSYLCRFIFTTFSMPSFSLVSVQ